MKIKKTIVIIVYLFLSNILVAQTPLPSTLISVLFENRFDILNGIYVTNGSNQYSVSIYDKDNNFLNLFNETNTTIDQLGFQSNYYKIYTYPLVKFPLKLKINASFNGTNSNGNNYSCVFNSNNSNPNDYDLEYYLYYDNSINQYSGIQVGSGNSFCHGVTNLTLLTLSDNTVKTIGNCDNIVHNYNYYYSNDVAPLKWQYMVAGSSNWSDLPQNVLQNTFPVNAIDFKVKDILGLENYSGVFDLRFEIDPLPVGTTTVLPYQQNSYSSILSFIIQDCTPKILSQSIPIDNNCSDGQTGSVTFTFNRPLLANEYINLSYKKNGLLDDESNISLGLNNEYILVGLASGEYEELNFQSNIINSFISYTVTTANSFTITAPPPIIFSTTKTNVKCRGNSTGCITVVASGGTDTPSSLRFSKDGGSNWQNSNVFLGLTAGIYPVLVKEINGASECIAPSGVSNVTITQSQAALMVSLDNFQDVYLANTGNPSLQGFINTTVAGGTPPYSYSWTANGNSITNNSNPSPEDLVGLSNASGTYNYTLTVTDANLCTASVTQQIISPESITATCAIEQIKCFAGKGKITATVSGGNAGAYTYSWTNSFSGEVITNTPSTSQISNLSPGNYTLTVTDFRGVSKIFAPQNINIAPSKIIIGGLTTVTQDCADINTTNIINISASGGTEAGTYGFRWYKVSKLNTVLSTIEDLSNVAPETYRVFVTDDNGCTESKDFTINPSSPITVSASLTTIVDPAINSGAINLTVNGGLTPYTFLWNNGASSQNLIGVAAGIYSVRVTDSKGCIFNSPDYTITAPPVFVVSVSPTAYNTCFGASSAALTVNASGGTPATTGAPYTYFWTHNGATTSAINNLLAGTYTVQVRDAKNILRTASYNVLQPTQITATAVASPTTCNLGNNGSITVNTLGGASPYEYRFTGEPNFSESNVKAGLTLGTYQCEVRDDEGCILLVNGIVVSQLSPPSITSANINPVSAFGPPDGAIQLSVIGGVPPYGYLWTGTSNITANPTGLAAGTYTVVVTDGNSCSVSATYNVTQILPLTATIRQTQVILCYGTSTASLTATGFGGIPGYTYQWSNGSTTQSILGLTAGVYSVVVKDNNTPVSSATATFTISQPQSIISAAITTQTNVSCFGNNTGSVSVAGSGGTIPYTYSWTNSSNVSIGGISSTLNGLVAGTYYCKVKDANSCETIVTVNITQPSSALTAVLLSKTDVTINGQSTGDITLTVTGGTAPYNYSWSNGITTTSTTVPTKNLLSAGTYSVTITDGKGCTTVLTGITITQPGVLQGSISETTQNSIKCFGDNTGSLTASVSGGIGNYVYVWKKNGIVIGNGSSINNLTAGIYQLTVSDNYTSTIVNYTLNQPTPVSATFTTTPVSCNGGNNGSVTVNASGGTPPYSYSWSNGSIAQTQIGLTAGNYVVSIKDKYNCDSGLLFSTVQPGNGINLNAIVINGACNSTSNGSITFAPTGGSGNFSITWNNQLYSGFVQNSLPPGLYTGVITDTTTGCVIPFSYTINGSAPINVNLGNDILLCNGQTIELDGTVNGNNLSYEWSSTNGFTSTNPKVTLNLAGNYTLKIIAGNGCIYTDNILITLSQQSIDSKYLIATQTFKDEEIILINVSDKSNTSYSWIFPVQAQIISQNQESAIIKFQTAGVFDIGLKGINNIGCVAYDYKKLVIDTNISSVANDNNNVLIKKFMVYPNPIPSNSNLFNIEVELAHNLPLTISIFSLSGSVLINEITLPSNKNHSKQFDLPNLSSGYYYVTIKTPGSIQGKKIIKQ